MTTPPERPKIYHMTHVDNLNDILADGMLVSDAAMIARGGPAKTIGMSGIKRRRVEKLEVQCHTGTKVGDYVPFYFCPRSVMLYVIYRADNPDLTYRGGQEPILHLEADLHRVVQWADANAVRWAFSLSNAGAYYAEFRSRMSDLNELDWSAIAARDFRDRDVQEGKQAEFLVFERFPFCLVDRIGVLSEAIRSQTLRSLARANQRTSVEVHPEWYY
jgi:hypothetical protein